MTANNSGELQRILITGGTGFVGPYLIRHLKPYASSIAVLTWGEGPYQPEPDVEYQSVDVRDQAAVRSVLQEVRPSRIYHLAGISAVDISWSNPRLTYEVNVSGALNVFEEGMSLSHTPRILNVSTSQVYAPSSKKLTENCPVRPNNPYAATKAMAELLVVQFAKSAGGIVTARSFNHSGPGQTANFFLSSVAKQFAEIELGIRPRKLAVGNLDVRRDFSDVRDVVRAYHLLVEKGNLGEIYNVCSGISTRLADIVDIFRSRIAVNVDIDTEPTRRRSNDVSEITGDSTKLREQTGWNPSVPLEQTIDDLLDHWRSKCRETARMVP
jgi:GDP-4-dehydro-6-deoxy-D-mannose reductase